MCQLPRTTRVDDPICHAIHYWLYSKLLFKKSLEVQKGLKHPERLLEIAAREPLSSLVQCSLLIGLTNPIYDALISLLTSSSACYCRLLTI